MDKYTLDVWKWDAEKQDYYQTTIKSFRHEDEAKKEYRGIKLSKNRIAKELWKITDEDNERIMADHYEEA